MLNNQAALYRVNKKTAGKDLWHKSYEEVQAQKLQVRIELYRMIHIVTMEPNETVSDIWKKNKRYKRGQRCFGCQSRWGTVLFLCK